MCVDCNNAAALSIRYPILANKLRKYAISPEFAIGTIGQLGKSGMSDEIRGLSGPTMTTSRSRDSREAALPFVRFVLFVVANPGYLAGHLATAPPRWVPRCDPWYR